MLTYELLPFLEFPDLAKLCTVCREMYHYVSKGPHFFEIMIHNVFGNLVKDLSPNQNFPEFIKNVDSLESYGRFL